MAKIADAMNEQIQKDLKANEAQLKADDKIISDYMAAHKLTGVKAPWGTYVVITNPGTGDNLSDTSIAVVNYTGKLIDGTEFDSSTKNGGPVTFPVGGVIKGWTEILQLMTKGAHWKVYIPAELAYGDRGAGAAIPPGATLIFDIMLEDIKAAIIQ